MIANITKGRSAFGLLNYLVGPGRHEEHRSPNVVAGSETMREMFERAPGEGWSRLDVWSLATKLEESYREQLVVEAAADRHDAKPHLRDRRSQRPRHVFHASMSLRAEEGLLGADRWSQIAEDYVARMGLKECGWVAVHHGQSVAGNDHIHIVVSLVKGDGTWASTSNDYARSMRAARAIEQRYGLRVLHEHEPGRGVPGYQPGETRQRHTTRTEAGERVSYTRLEPQRVRLERLVRVAASAASSEADFLRLLWASNILTRPRWADGGRVQVAGYSVSLRNVTDADVALWFGGGKLARDLTLPELRKRWLDGEVPLRMWGADTNGQNVSGADPWTVSTKQRWDHDVVAHLRQAERGWRSLGDHDRTAWARAASDTAGLLGVAAHRLADARLAGAARDFARLASGRDPVATPPRLQRAEIGQAVRLLMVAGGRNEIAGWLAVLAQLRRLGEAVEEAGRARGDAAVAARAHDAIERSVTVLDSEFAAAGLLRDPRAGADLEEARAAAGAFDGRRQPDDTYGLLHDSRGARPRATRPGPGLDRTRNDGRGQPR